MTLPPLTRPQRIEAADRHCIATSDLFVDTVLRSDATDTQQAMILRAHRDVLTATRHFLRTSLAS